MSDRTQTLLVQGAVKKLASDLRDKAASTGIDAYENSARALEIVFDEEILPLLSQPEHQGDGPGRIGGSADPNGPHADRVRATADRQHQRAALPASGRGQLRKLAEDFEDRAGKRFDGLQDLDPESALHSKEKGEGEAYATAANFLQEFLSSSGIAQPPAPVLSDEGTDPIGPGCPTCNFEPCRCGGLSDEERGQLEEIANYLDNRNGDDPLFVGSAVPFLRNLASQEHRGEETRLCDSCGQRTSAGGRFCDGCNRRGLDSEDADV